MCKLHLSFRVLPSTDSDDHDTTLASTMSSDWSTVKQSRGGGSV